MSQDGVSAEEIQAMKAIMGRLKKHGIRDFASETSEAEVPGTIADSSKRLLDDSIISFDMAFDDEPWDLPCDVSPTGSSTAFGQQVISSNYMVLRRLSCRLARHRSRSGARLCVSCLL
jgi:hypothetical protein